MSRKKRTSTYVPGAPLANQAYWESQGHKLIPDADTPEEAAAKDAERDAVKARNSESVREMFASGQSFPDHRAHTRAEHMTINEIEQQDYRSNDE